MGFEDAFNVSSTVYFDVVAGLVDFDAIEVMDESEILERRFGFRWELKFLSNDIVNFLGNVLVGTGKGEIVDLSEEIYCCAFKDGFVDAVISS